MSALTKTAIRQAFLKLLRERPVSRITIRDIVTECGINRNTFYYHYHDLPALAEEVIMDEANKFIESCTDVSSIEDCIELAVSSMLRHKRSVLHLHQSSSRDLYERYLWKICGHVVRAFLESALHDVQLTEPEFAALLHFYQCACFGQLIDWLDGGMREDIRAKFHTLVEVKRRFDLRQLYAERPKKSDTSGQVSKN